MKTDGEWGNFLQEMYNLSLKFKSENSKLVANKPIEQCDIVVKDSTKKQNDVPNSNKQANNLGLGHVTISINKVNYSLKNLNRKKSCWNSFLPEQYLSLFRGVFSVFMLVTTVFAIYGIVKLLDIRE